MDRIAIIGCGGSGKTHLANQLAALLNLPLTHLDSVYYDADWNPLPAEDFAALQTKLVAEPRWLIEGNYAGSLPIRSARADTVIFLDLPALTCLAGILQRRWRYRGGQHAKDGVYDRITWDFVRYIWGYRTSMRPRVRGLLRDRGGAATYERATSVYFPRRVIPMLPEKISNGLCSLNPNEDRLAMVCDMLVDATGEVQAYQFFPAVICSQARFTYTEVAAILANTRGPEAARRKELVPHLLHLHEVYRALLKERAKRGAVDFETTETQIVCDDNGRIEKIVPRTRTEAHKLIEEAMLAANVCSADFIARAKHPALYRVHEGPTPEKRTLLQNYLKALGLGLSVSDDPKPGEFQAIAAATKDRPDALQIHTMLLRSMQQAIYTGTNSGHFGLAYDAYTHFTSPIRRYPDLLVHRVIKALLHGKRYHLLSGAFEEAPKLRVGHKPAKSASAELEHWEAAGAHCSTNERRADEASRDVEAWLKCRYMREHLGEEFGGTVSAVTSFGLFVTLDGLYVEGLVHITELGGEYYRFDEARQELRGERSGIRHHVGSRVRVQVSRVDLDGRKIDFRLVREGEDDTTRLRTRQRHPDKSEGGAEELETVRQADRAAKAGAKSRSRTGTSKGAHPVQAAKSAARKGSAGRSGTTRRR